jgi:hypothetical protein
LNEQYSKCIPALGTNDEAFLREFSSHGVRQNSQLTGLEPEDDTNLIVEATVRIQVSQSGNALSFAT